MTLAFVLGAGSSRGALQAGALEALYAADIKPDMLVGSSIGGINGVYMAQEPKLETILRLQKLFRQADFDDVFGGNKADGVLNVLRGEENVFQQDALEELLREQLDVTTFGELSLPCYVATTEMDRGELHVFGDDPDDEIMPALLSTAAMLPVYPPREVNGYRYADGGILASLPIQVAVARGADEIIALNLTTQLKPPDDRDSALDMMLHTIDLLLHAQVELTRAFIEHKAEIPVHIIDLEPEEYTGLLDLDEMDRLIDRGRELTEQALEEIDIGDH